MPKNLSFSSLPFIIFGSLLYAISEVNDTNAWYGWKVSVHLFSQNYLRSAYYVQETVLVTVFFSFLLLTLPGVCPFLGLQIPTLLPTLEHLDSCCMGQLIVHFFSVINPAINQPVFNCRLIQAGFLNLLVRKTFLFSCDVTEIPN